MIRAALRAGLLLALGPVANWLGVTMLAAEAATENEVALGQMTADNDVLAGELLAALKDVDRLEAERDELVRLLERVAAARPASEADTFVRWELAAWLTRRALGERDGEGTAA